MEALLNGLSPLFNLRIIIMKKVFLSLLAFSAMMLSFVSCDDANNTTEYFFDGIYSVRGQMIFPELEDTFYVVDNIEEHGLVNGDRAVMRVNCFVDNVIGAHKAKWSIETVYDVIPTLDVDAAADVNADVYSSPLVGLTPYNTYGAAWLWNGIQNINVVYYSDGSEPQFKMVTDGFVNDTLRLSLYAKINDGETAMPQLLSFDISTALQLLDSNQLQALQTVDTLCTKVDMLYYDAKADVVETVEIIGGKTVNPFRK